MIFYGNTYTIKNSTISIQIIVTPIILKKLFPAFSELKIAICLLMKYNRAIINTIIFHELFII